ncbi:uncharacterized protein Triagg1_1836 [Trichoderma aggressivum f. europaeum]|uniref:Uncharacterized protein n=1 Tax=Trichoderma aggressivum f. europaeum TaxID=173218 RepID=A0AAE1JG90_9HYPO|nr:hypothetical protein Triagg1_1836 [Trichoderma aggressivum f. europaeum]
MQVYNNMRRHFRKITNFLSRKRKNGGNTNGVTSSSTALKDTHDPLITIPATSVPQSPHSQSVPEQLVPKQAASLARTGHDTWALAFEMARERESKSMLAYEQYLSSLQSDSAACGDFSTPEFIKSIVEWAIEDRERKRWRVSLLGTDIELCRGWNDIINPDVWEEKIQNIHQLDDECRNLLHVANADQIERNWKQQLLEMQESRILLNRIHGTLMESESEAQKSYKDQKEKGLLQALASDYEGHKDFTPRKVDGTCEWFFTEE